MKAASATEDFMSCTENIGDDSKFDDKDQDGSERLNDTDVDIAPLPEEDSQTAADISVDFGEDSIVCHHKKKLRLNRRGLKRGCSIEVILIVVVGLLTRPYALLSSEAPLPVEFFLVISYVLHLRECFKINGIKVEYLLEQ